MALPPIERDDAVGWVRAHLGDLAREGPDGVAASGAFRGGQAAADAALAAFDVAGYAARRNDVWPAARRGASALSPYIRHGLLPLPRVWDHVAAGPARDRGKFRDELLWQEHARHLYARLGRRTSTDLRFQTDRLRRSVPSDRDAPDPAWPVPYPREMRCLDLVLTELAQDGWVPNQTRMWLASQWSVRAGRDWRVGEAFLYSQLLDGSRAANRLGWQWTVGAGTGRPYGFSQHQVLKRAPGTCGECALRDACPIGGWPPTSRPLRVPADPRLSADPDLDTTTGPLEPVLSGSGAPDVVWLTGESLGDADPALAAHPDLPAVFVFDEAFLRSVRLSGKRLVFLAETLGDLATRRPVELHRGDPVTVLRDRRLAATHAPVSGWRRRAAALDLRAVHPWPWLAQPHAGPIGSYSAWRRAVRVRGAPAGPSVPRRRRAARDGAATDRA